MGSREVNTFGIASEDLAAGLKDCLVVKDFDGVVNAINEIAKLGDIVITMGGGDIYKAAYICRDLEIGK
jgi:UDP-N-acetylmuramate--alanine ligase